MFVAREEELSLLEALLSRQASSFTVLYGRRRIGKTEMVRHFIEKNDLTAIEVTGVYGATKATQINAFYRKIIRAIDGKLSIHKRPKEWQELFFLLEEYVDLVSDEKVVLFFDEFPWFDTHRSGFLSAFSEFWNDFCTRKKHIILIVCGSAASYMINKIVKNKKTLHNRITHKINMFPFDLKATKKLLKAKRCRYSNKSIIDTYITLGGVAKYLSDLDCSKHQAENINFHCFNKNGLLITEYQELYESLFKNAKWHYQVMTLLSSRWSGFIQKDIALTLNTSASVIKDVLEELELSGFVSSVTKFGQTTRDKVYRASDPFSYFYNKWMKNNKGVDWKNIATSNQYKIWSGFAFENICHLHIDSIKKVLGVSGVNTQTHYWNHKGDSTKTGAQIDILLEYVDGSKNIDIIECKYYDSVFKISKKYYHELKNKIAVFNEQTRHRYNIRLIFVTTFGVEENEYYNELVHHQMKIDELL